MSKHTDEFRRLVTVGTEAFHGKEYDKAEQSFLKALHIGKPFADVYYMMGIIFYHKGDLKKACGYLEEAVAINPGYTEAATNLALVYNELGNYRDARRVYDTMAKTSSPVREGELEPYLKSKVANMYADIGDVFRSCGHHILAVEEYRRALGFCPQYLDIRNKLAQSLRDLGRHEDAITAFREILGANANFHGARVNLGVTLYATGRHAEAAAEWREVLRRDYANKSARMYLRMIHENLPGEGGTTLEAEEKKD
ncbi:MAG: tetratricopeptide repeat protein [Deltaproteobacteria bacterium]|nr:tetratricopeptide repeat protein [Deltaproteobacteria bacterium]